MARITSRIENINDSSKLLSRGTEELNATIEEINSSTQEITATIDALSNKSELATNSSKEIKERALNMKDLVSKSVEMQMLLLRKDN